MPDARILLEVKLPFVTHYLMSEVAKWKATRATGGHGAFLQYTHSLPLVLASLAVALMASFTGLTLTRGLAALGAAQRKQRIAMASIAMGGGIWSKHFVAMLGVRLPILYYYDALTTMVSVLVAILMVGIALLVLHFRARTLANIVIAGIIVGMGIPTMHYIGMAGMQLCKLTYTSAGVVLAVSASVMLGIGSFAIAFGHRTRRIIVLGTVTFGIAIFAVHFLAMAGTNFLQVAVDGVTTASIGNTTLALIVALTTFVICGVFLLAGVTFLPSAAVQYKPTSIEDDRSTLAPIPVENVDQTGGPGANAIPYQKDGHTRFVRPADVAALRAEGHYSILYVADEKHFCQWSISLTEERLPKGCFIRCHRSYLINPDHVSRFERRKDNGVCTFAGNSGLGPVPVSQSRLTEVRKALGLV